MASEDLDLIEERLRQRQTVQNSLHLKSEAADLRGSLPNTPFTVATIAFILGGVFTVSFLTFTFGGFNEYWWTTYQLAFFLAAWSFFHWAEFAVTAGWNLEKCNIDCEKIYLSSGCSIFWFPDIVPIAFLLNNGNLYHIAHTIALTEYLVTLYFKPEAKKFAYISQLGVY
jgi:protein-S-isoprenylcysteine O-methyltransferase